MHQEKKYYKLGLIGYPVKHSLSPKIHQGFLKQTNLQGKYQLFNTPEYDIPELIKQLQSEQYTGVNITIPHKQAIQQYCTIIQDCAKNIEAVNTIYFNGNNIIGSNTDYLGFWDSISEYHHRLIHQSNKILLLGAGGSANAVVYALNKFLPADYQLDILVRDKPESIRKAQVLQSKYSNINICTNTEQLHANYNLIVNTTPLGMLGDHINSSPLPEEFIKNLNNSECLIYDLIYNPEVTLLLQYAHKYNLAIINGYKMLELQARHSFKTWTGY